MRRGLTLAVALVALLTSACSAAAEDASSSIVGLWKITSLARKVVATGKTEQPFGERPSGYWIFTRGGHTVHFFVGDNRKAPAASPTDAERIALFKTLVAWSGTYNVEGTKLVLHLDASWVQSWTGTVLVGFTEINGNKLTFTTEPFRAGLDNQEIVTISTYERAE